MKHRVLCILMGILIILSLTGCGKSNSGQESDRPVNNTEDESQESISSSQQIQLPSASLNASWPKDLVPAELPEYTDGTVTASGEDGGTLYIKIKETDKSELDNYLERLKEAGWIVTSYDNEAEAVLGTHTVNFMLQGDGSYLQMDVYTTEAGTWPSDEIPPDVIPPITGTLVDQIEILDQTEGIWYFNYTYDGIDEAGANEYMQMLRENGWEGDDYMVSKSFEWKGKLYGASIEVYETLETRTTFTCNYLLN